MGHTYPWCITTMNAFIEQVIILMICKAIYYRPTYASYKENSWSKAVIMSMYSLGHHSYVTLSLKHNVMMSQVCYKRCHVYQCHDLSGHLHLPLFVLLYWSLTCCAFTMPSINLQTEALAHIMSRVTLKVPKDVSKQKLKAPIYFKRNGRNWYDII